MSNKNKIKKIFLGYYFTKSIKDFTLRPIKGFNIVKYKAINK
jgi:hypothetical protein